MAAEYATGTVGVIGATSPVGRCAIDSLLHAGINVVAFSRTPETKIQRVGLQWRNIAQLGNMSRTATGTFHSGSSEISHWYCFAPIWILEEYLPVLNNCRVVRILALSSTSLFTKAPGALSADLREHVVAERLQRGETSLSRWAQTRGTEWVVLRPTMIYGGPNDRNLSEILRFIKTFKCFPLLGPAKGLRQPIRVEDVAIAAVQAMRTQTVRNLAYNIAGSETLTYQDMVTRAFRYLGFKPRFIRVPLLVFSALVAVVRLVPRYRGWSVAMAERMNSDLVFDSAPAQRDFGFIAHGFDLTPITQVTPRANF